MREIDYEGGMLEGVFSTQRLAILHAEKRDNLKHYNWQATKIASSTGTTTWQRSSLSIRLRWTVPPFQKSDYRLGDPIFMVEYKDAAEPFQVVRTLPGLKAKLRAWRHGSASRKVYVCPNPQWVEMHEVTQEEVELADGTRIAAEVERIRSLYEEGHD